ncbi:MAG: hypothetical protein CMD26_01295 [Flavobacteriales bacterium]|nr:hypothetical protein [Flavobacteriales bacterium]
MIFFRFIFLLIITSHISVAQDNGIKSKFSQNVLREDFDEQNLIFPTTTESNGKYSILIDKDGYYGLGSGNSEYPLLIQWKNDLNNFELKTSIRLKDESEWETVQKIQGQTGQIFGLLLKYNPDNQEALIFQINGVRQYRLSYLRNEKMRHLSEWKDSKHIKRNDANQIKIRTKDNNYEFYINNQFVFKKNLERYNDVLTNGNFGFYLGKNTQAMIDYIYISTEKEYNGINKLLNLSQSDAEKIIAEKEKFKIDLQNKKKEEIEELTNVIKILENELKNTHQKIDSLKFENHQYEPFKNIINENGDFMLTLTKDLKYQIEQNQILKNNNSKLLDSISILINKQEEFKLEYLNVLDRMMQNTDTTNTKKDTIR